jgi:hypothetical protein
VNGRIKESLSGGSRDQHSKVLALSNGVYFGLILRRADREPSEGVN